MEYLFLALICLPKINIFGFESVSQGIRIDDILVLIIFLKVFSKINIDIKCIYIYIIILIISLIGLINNYNDFIFLRLMSLLRLLEYIIVFYSAKILLSKQKIANLIKVVIIFQFIVVIFQYISDSSIRPSGTTAGPWELGLIVSVSAIYLTAYFGFKGAFVYNCMIAIILLLASARAQLLGITIVALFAIYKEILRIDALIKILISLILIILTICLIYFIDYGYINFSRSINFVRDFYIDVIDDIMNLRVTIKTSDYDVKNYDPSLVSRALQWQEYVSTISEAKNIPYAVLFGSGANSGGLILDGFYIKLMVDFGLFGLFIYIFYLIKIVINSKYAYYGLLIAISSFTLDLLWASKFMYALLISISLINKGNND